MRRALTFRQSAALVSGVVGLEAVLSAATPDRPSHHRLIARIAPPALPSAAHLLALVMGLGLVMLAPKLWRGTRTAVALAIPGLLVLALLNLVKGLDWDEGLLDVCLAFLLAIGRGAFPLGCRRRPQLAAVCAAIGAWALTYCALLFGPLVSDRGHTLGQALHNSIGRPHLSSDWITIVELLLICAVTISLLAFRSLLRPAAGRSGHTDYEYRTARAIVERSGEDSLSPFVLRSDKALHFDGDGVLAYRLIGESAVVSGDPVALGREPAKVLSSFQELARSRGWQIVLWGASSRYLAAYRSLGLRAVCVGEEAFADPGRFTLEGRRVRKLRQSVNRLQRRGWRVSVREGRELDAALSDEIESFEARWRASVRKVRGFAMTMGASDPNRQPDDVYVTARSQEGELRAVMRFIRYRRGLSLDTMHRLDGAPNGLNEALVSYALQFAREREIPEVSLNYAGLAHLVRGVGARGWISRLLVRILLATLGRCLQLARLVHFDDKFDPEWRPRYLVYDSLGGLPRAGLRVLQAEGYLPQAKPPRLPLRWRPAPRPLPGSPQADAAR
jgi:lysyl-tRNA synthetase, class II